MMPEKCFITDMPTEAAPTSKDVIFYFTHFNGKRYLFEFPWDHQNSEFVEQNKYILKGLLINGKFPYSKQDPFLDNDILEKIIKEAQLPGTPKEKLDNLLLYLHENQIYYGSEINIKTDNWDIVLNKLYFKNQKEYWFFLSALKEQGLITFMDVTAPIGNADIDIKLTFKGLDYIINLQESGEKSKYCFIAMSFADSTLGIRETIKKVIRELGYFPLIVDEIHFDSDMTINDAIIKYIKQSKFLIADFTEQKHGVYFETGYALGIKRPVIYTCSKSDFKSTHFDTNHYPHIVYGDLNELEIKLKDKVQAWIE